MTLGGTVVVVVVRGMYAWCEEPRSGGWKFKGGCGDWVRKCVFMRCGFRV